MAGLSRTRRAWSVAGAGRVRPGDTRLDDRGCRAVAADADLSRARPGSALAIAHRAISRAQRLARRHPRTDPAGARRAAFDHGAGGDARRHRRRHLPASEGAGRREARRARAPRQGRAVRAHGARRRAARLGRQRLDGLLLEEVPELGDVALRVREVDRAVATGMLDRAVDADAARAQAFDLLLE